MSRKAKTPKCPTLLRKVDVVEEVEVNEWAVVAGGVVTGWVTDPAAATVIGTVEACKIQVAMEAADPTARYLPTRDDITAARLTGGELEWVSDSYDGTRGRGDY